MIADYPWGRFYETAILETDRSKLAKHIQVAEQAIMTRSQELDSHHSGSEVERAAIRDALSGLKILQKEIAECVADGNLGSGSQVHRCSASNSQYCGQEQE